MLILQNAGEQRRRRFTGVVLLALCCAVAVPRRAGAEETAEAGKTVPAKELVGLWKAKKSFGPEVRGALTLEHQGERWTATIAGFSVRADAAGDEISFELPGERGRFQGMLKAAEGTLSGHWLQPPPRQIGGWVALAGSFHSDRAGTLARRGRSARERVHFLSAYP